MTMKSYMNHMKKMINDTNQMIKSLESRQLHFESPDYKYLKTLKIRVEIYKENLDYWLSKSIYLDSEEKLLHNPSFIDIPKK